MRSAKISWFFPLLATVFVAAFVILLFRNAWVSDDAYLTFRAVENFLHGYGPVFNVGERVQIFTHPLWFFTLSASYALCQAFAAGRQWSQLPYLSVYLGMGLSLATGCLVVFGVASTLRGRVVSAFVLLLSKAFIDYTTSGLENALSYLLFAGFLAIYFRAFSESPRRLFLLSLLAGLSALNRLDTLLLFLPPLTVLFWETHPRRAALLPVLAGFVPLIVWEFFSLFYYGLPFPNTAYAKLISGISRWELFQQGVLYWFSSLKLDPLTPLVLVGCLAYILKKGDLRGRLVAGGIAVYLLYLLFIGGDFMSGRFFALPLLGCAALLGRLNYPGNAAYAGLLVGLLALGLLNPRSPLRSSTHYGAVANGDFWSTHVDYNGIADERAFYYWYMGLLSELSDEPLPDSAYSGKSWVYHPGMPVTVEQATAMGLVSYQRGPNVHFIDDYALADALLARLPVRNPATWRVGHIEHIIPEGYLETLSSGRNRIKDENLAAYYDRLTLVTRGELWSLPRFVAIWKMNTGQYDRLIEAFYDEMK